MTTHEWWMLWAVGALAVVVFTAGGLTWWLHWQCVDGFWHWRKECNGHEMRLLPTQAAPPGADDGRFVGREDSRTLLVGVAGDAHGDVTAWPDWQVDPDEAEAALDEAWPDTLHAINTDLHQPAPDLLGLDDMPWADRMLIEQWDWRMRMVGERKAHRLGCGLEWRDDMGLAA